MQNEIETIPELPELSAKEQRGQFEIRFREAIRQSIPCQNTLSVRMLNEMLKTFGDLSWKEGHEIGYEDGIRYARNFGDEINRLDHLGGGEY